MAGTAGSPGSHSLNAMPPTLPTLNIVGCGKVGRTLARLWQAAGVVQLQDIVNRTPASAAAAIDFIGGGAMATLSTMRRADLVMIGTGDDQIAAQVNALAAVNLSLDGSIVFHCSGALPSAVLSPLKNRGAAIASVHPVRSFALPERVVGNFAGTWCGVEGDASAIAALEPLFRHIGAHFIAIDGTRKVLYHAGAVFASNYLVTLLDTAIQAYRQAGIAETDALKIMRSLVVETVENVLSEGPEQALTGPVARGDVATVVRQYKAVRQWDCRYGKLYRHFGKLTRRLALRNMLRKPE